MEIAKAVKSGNPESYVCHFPVHQDGSCNGLQHYAALGRDEAGAESVNLKPASRPQDVYSCVAAMVSGIMLCSCLLSMWCCVVVLWCFGDGDI
jgi:DNA-directed RNA polymerase